MSTQAAVTCPNRDSRLCTGDPSLDLMQNGVFSWVRMALNGSVGVGDGWVLSGQLPVDSRSLDLSYTLPDGSDFSSATLNSQSHRVGLGDPGLQLAKIGRWPGGWVLSLRGGLHFPFGEVQKEAFAAGREGVLQRNMQLGTGVFQSTASVHLVKELGLWRALVGGSFRMPLGENDWGYRPGRYVNVESSVSREFGQKTDALVGVSWNRKDPDEWGALTYPGVEALNLTTGVTRHLGLNWLVEGVAQTQLVEALIGAEQPEVPTRKVQVTLGMSWRN